MELCEAETVDVPVAAVLCGTETVGVPSTFCGFDVRYAYYLARLIIMRASFSESKEPPSWIVLTQRNQAQGCASSMELN